MRCTYGIGTHLLQQFHLVAKRSAIHSCTKRTEVVMVAHTLEFRHLAVKEESLFGYIVD